MDIRKLDINDGDISFNITGTENYDYANLANISARSHRSNKVIGRYCQATPFSKMLVSKVRHL